MPKFDSPLDNINIASPCSADWSEMYGDERKRFCGDCKLNVYNLSGMTRDEAESLMMNAEGRLCVRFYKRADGSVITQDCPAGWAKVKQRTKILATAAASMVMTLLTGVFFVTFFSKGRANITMGEMTRPLATLSPTPTQLMGAIAVPPRNTNTESKDGPHNPQMTMGKVAMPKQLRPYQKDEIETN